MKEDFLHYLWKFSKFDIIDLQTTDGEFLQILQVGQHNHNAGPDFFNGQVRINGQVWAGNIEIHIKSSDWYAHRHEEDPAYDNVVLHIVWEHDASVFRKDNQTIPTLVLKDKIAPDTLHNYHALFNSSQKWINCESQFSTVDEFTFNNWKDRLFIERLEQKNELILHQLDQCKNDWEAVLFVLLCKNFGLKVNGASFLSIGNSLDFSVVRKASVQVDVLEAILFGQAGLLDLKQDDLDVQRMQELYAFQKVKFQLDNASVIVPKYFRLRPPNFPTIRLSQLASLYATHRQLFEKVITTDDVEELYAVFKISALPYWDTHYNFGVEGKKRKKTITKSFIDLLLINTILPLKYCYAKSQGKDVIENINVIASKISAEKNTIVDKFNTLKNVAETAMDSQALLQLKKHYCDPNRCLQCAVGNSILGRKIS